MESSAFKLIGRALGLIAAVFCLSAGRAEDVTVRASFENLQTRLDISAPPNRLVKVQGSSDLVTWEDLGSALTGPDGLGTIFDEVGLLYELRFFRATFVFQTPSPAGPLMAFISAPLTITLQWSEFSTNEDEFIIERSVDGIAFEEIDRIGNGETEFDDSLPAGAARYWYRVKAANTAGNSPPTAANPIDIPPAPQAPASLEATVLTGYGIDLSWAPSLGAVFYEIERAVPGADFESLDEVEADADGFLDLDGEAGFTYVYRVTAVGLGGESDPSALAMAMYPLPEEPGFLVAPFDGSSLTSVAVKLQWMKVSGADGYDFEVRDAATDRVVAGYGINYTGPFRGTSISLQLDYAKSYRWRARARILPNNNEWSGYWRFSTPPVPLPGQRSPADGSSGLSIDVNLSWGGVQDADGYDFEVRRKSDDVLIAGYGITYSDGPYRATSVSLHLEYGASYRWRVRGRVLPQDNPWTEYWTFTTGPVPPPPQLVSPSDGRPVSRLRLL